MSVPWLLPLEIQHIRYVQSILDSTGYTYSALTPIDLVFNLDSAFIILQDLKCPWDRADR